jgi:hypothetical protein
LGDERLAMHGVVVFHSEGMYCARDAWGTRSKVRRTENWISVGDMRFALF